MSAEILRRAAALMCERADRATPSPWIPDAVSMQDLGGADTDYYVTHPPTNGAFDSLVGEVSGSADADHIASWHPDVALAVAALMDGLASDEVWDFRHDEALTVARAYLGEPA